MSAVRVRALAILTVVLVGCSGAGNQDLFDDSASGNATSSVNPTTPAGSTKTPGASDTKTPSDGAPAPTTPAPTPTMPVDPVQPPADNGKCTAEIEPNDTAAKATAFTSRFCGKIDTASDVDFGTFVVPKGAQSIVIQHSEKGGSVTYRYLVNGVSMPAIDIGDIQLDVVPGTTYAISARASQFQNGSGQHPTYEVDVTFK